MREARIPKKYIEVLIAISIVCLLNMPALGIDYSEYKDWMQKGKDFYNQGSYELALRAFDKALELKGYGYDEEWADAFGWKGRALIGLEEYDEAIKAFDKALSYDKEDWLWSRKGDALSHLKKYSEAVTAYDEAIAINPVRKDSWFGKGAALEEMGKYDEAINALNNLLDIDPNYAGTWMQKGHIYEKMGRNQSALDAYDKEQEINPSQGAIYEKIDLLIKMDEYDGALGAIEKMIEQDPNAASYWWREKGKVFDLQGSYDEAIKAYDEAINLNSNDTLSLYAKGNDKYNLSKFEEAVDSYDKAIEIVQMRINNVQESDWDESEKTSSLKRWNDHLEDILAAKNRSLDALNIHPPTNISKEIFPGRIIGIDFSSFPRIKLNAFIDTICGRSGELLQDNFAIEENNADAAIEDMYFTGNASGKQLDLAVVFDNTLSMSDEINAMKSNAQDLIDQITRSELDARYSLVTFKEDVDVGTEWTSDPAIFSNIVDKISVGEGTPGTPENAIEGVETVLSFGFRPSAQKVILVITDEPSHQAEDGSDKSDHTLTDTTNNLRQAGVTLFAVSPDFTNVSVDPGVSAKDLSKYADMKDLANEAGGRWIDINSEDFSSILERFTSFLTETYVLEYISRDTQLGTDRIVTVMVNQSDCAMGSISANYTSTG